MQTTDADKQTLSLEVCDCPSCRKGNHPIGRFYDKKDKVAYTFLSKHDGNIIIVHLLADGLITEENAVEMSLGLKDSRMIPFIPDNPFGIIGAKANFLRHLEELCEEEGLQRICGQQQKTLA